MRKGNKRKMAQGGAVAKATDRFERKREAILDAATRLLNRKGIKGLTLGATAAAVDLSTTSVTYYFRRKDDLAAACISRGIETLLGIAEAAVTAPTPAERLHSFFTISRCPEGHRCRGGVATADHLGTASPEFAPPGRGGPGLWAAVSQGPPDF